MKRVLVFGMTENPGGVESFLMNYYRHMDGISFDFLCNSHAPIAYEDELLSTGSRTFHVTSRRRDPIAFHREMKALFDQHAREWRSIWVNISSLANIDYLKLAKQYGIEKRIIHSHNSGNMDGWLRGLLHSRNKAVLDRYATDFWACSTEAAKWFYKDELLPEVQLIRNAIDVGRMAHDENARQRIRDMHDLDGKLVIGNVGRLHFQKNQTFALDALKAVLARGVDARLILVGQGADEGALKEKAHRLGIDGAVLFAGVQQNISAWLSAFDVFLFPSLFEGLPVAALEAQANGVPIVAADPALAPEAILNANCETLDLNADLDLWAQRLIEQGQAPRIASDVIRRNFITHGFDIEMEAKKLEGLLR